MAVQTRANACVLRYVFILLVPLPLRIHSTRKFIFCAPFEIKSTNLPQRHPVDIRRRHSLSPGCLNSQIHHSTPPSPPNCSTGISICTVLRRLYCFTLCYVLTQPQHYFQQLCSGHVKVLENINVHQSFKKS